MRMEEKWRGKKTETVIILAAAFCVVVACVSIYTVSSIARQRPPQTEPASGLVAEANVKIGTLNNMEGRQEELDEIVKEGLITFSINATPVMENGRAEANLLIENPPDNGNRFTVSISREDTGEELYQSGYLDPEQYIDEVPLDVELPKGEYACTAYFDAYRLSDDGYIGRAGAQITLYVLE